MTLVLAACTAQQQQPDMPTSSNTAGNVERAIPKALKTRYQTAITQLQNEQIELASQGFRALTIDYPTYSGAYINLGLIELKRKQTDEAENLFRQAISVNPESFSGHHQLAILYRKKGQFDQAESHYLHAIKIDPSSPEVHRNLAILYDLYMGKLTQALTLYQTYQSLLPEPDPVLKGWIIDIKNRIKAQNKNPDKNIDSAITEN
ncbi:MAG: tetratricopeptide repeat protein [Pseudomonadales bacterium]|nr:tetratricopeptide repeat protein [Pseudomonadales bacterium]